MTLDQFDEYTKIVASRLNPGIFAGDYGGSDLHKFNVLMTSVRKDLVNEAAAKEGRYKFYLELVKEFGITSPNPCNEILLPHTHQFRVLK